MTDLREFIRQTLVDILGGIRDAQQAEGIGSFIVPQGAGIEDAFPKDKGVYHGQKLISTVVQFDIAVSAETTESKTGKAGINVKVVEGGAQREAGSKNSDLSRIQFSVPLLLPHSQRSWVVDQANPFPVTTSGTAGPSDEPKA